MPYSVEAVMLGKLIMSFVSIHSFLLATKPDFEQFMPSMHGQEGCEMIKEIILRGGATYGRPANGRVHNFA